MTTRKQLIEEKYTELINRLDGIIPNDLFPKLDEIDVVDMVFLFNISFETNSKNNYRQALKDVIYCQGVQMTDMVFETVYEIVQPFIIFLKQLK